MTADEVLSSSQKGGAFYLRGKAGDGIIVASYLNRRNPNVVVYRQVADEDVGRAMPEALREAIECGYERVAIRDVGRALDFHGSKILYSSLEREEEVSALAEEIAGTAGWREDFGRVDEYLSAIECLRAFEAKEYGYVYGVDDDPLDYLYGDYADLTRLPVAATMLDNPLLSHVPEASQMFEVEVSCDLVHAELVTDITWFKPVVEGYGDLSAMRDALLEFLDFDQLVGWETEIEDALRGNGSCLEFKHEGIREMLADPDAPIYRANEMVRPSGSLPFSTPLPVERRSLDEEVEEVL